ncbi:MAG: TonB-dependent receptor [Gammaproteobacteria bacterium]|nr:TonB-dependent receptor [Gammaproteobacteria bacterium]
MGAAYRAILSVSIVFPLIAAAGAAEAQPSGQDEAAGPVEEIFVVGSRRRDRSADDSPVPVDVIGGDDFLSQGDSDMDSLLAALVPSYNVAQEPISDAATFIRPATLRSLPPDATLVLVNGKRRHRAAVIALLGAGISGGSQGPDLSVIPAIALDRLEVLRDGASAQYGSDAIAGIMNFVLKEDDSGFTLDAKWGSHFEGDGDALTIAGNAGFGLSDAGFGNISFEFKEQDPTSRSVQRDDAQGLINAGNASVRQPAAQIWGAPEISDDYKLFGNFGIDLGNGAEAYMFGNWAQRQVEGGFYYRNPHTRNGVFRGPEINGMKTVKVADFSGATAMLVNQGMELADAVAANAADGGCPIVNIVDNVADPAALSEISGRDDCYSLIEKFPGGFTPQFGGYVDDISFAAGVRGELDSGWFYDLSAVAGQSGADFYIYNTINPQLFTRRNDIPTYYDAGGYVETDRVANFDLSRQFFPGNVDSVNVAMGVEYRDETFTIRNGEPNSFFIDPNLAAQGFGVGSNGFAGFQPGDAGENTVRAFGAYLDVESSVNEVLLLGGALRFEDYADFGDTLDGKVTARLQVADNVALRGAVSTGFRVPTAGQANLRNVTTEFNMGRLADIATLPPDNPIAQQKGATPLTPEESVNTTLGLVFSAGDLDVTLDYYNIEISDRIAFTSRFNLTPADIDALLAAGVSDAQSFTSVRFFSNQQTVEASGIDLVATLPFDLGQGDSTLTVVANWSDVELTDFDPNFTSDNRRLQIERGRPDSRFTATWSHLQGAWRFMARVRHYGEFYDAPTNDGSVAYYPEPATLFDFEAAYEVSDSFTVIGGLQNAFDEYPMINPHGEVAGLIYPEQSPFGFNGGFYYLRATWNAF